MPQSSQVIVHPTGAVSTVWYDEGQDEGLAVAAALTGIPGGAAVPAWVPNALTPKPATLTRAEFVKAHAGLWLRLAFAAEAVKRRWLDVLLPLLDHFAAFDPADPTLAGFLAAARADGLLD